MKDSDIKAMFPWPADIELQKNGKHYDDKSTLHWQKQARKLYASCLLRASSMVPDGPVGQMVTKHILDTHEREDPEMLKEVFQQKETYDQDLGRAMRVFTLTPVKHRTGGTK
ncbi:MAG: hypothetical protein H0U59_13140 [Gemmatimonadaceae bacterium]|nr:hypothetical protein [Gemmatimonadaceae bacterium]